MKNIFSIPKKLKTPLKDEFFEDLFEAKNVRVERIISQGQTSPKDFWYNQEQDEWVIILQGYAEITTKDEKEIETLWKLKAGDSMFFKAHHKHRVEKTSVEPKTIWLAIYGNINNVKVSK